MPKTNEIVALAADVEVSAAATEGKPATFRVVAYTGGAMELGGWDLPVVVDLDAIRFGKSLVANLDHDRTKRVGHVTAQSVIDGQLILEGVISAATESAREVSQSASSGFVWQASIEASPTSVQTIKAGDSVTVNGQTHKGPLYVAASTLKGFGFVSHGADDNTQVSIAATATTPKKEVKMKPEIKAWAESMGLDVENATAEQIATIEANYGGKPTPKPAVVSIEDGFEKLRAEQDRKSQITQYALTACEGRFGSEIDAIKLMAERSIQAGEQVNEFRLKLMEATAPSGASARNPQKDTGLSNRVLEAAICQAGRLPGHEDRFNDNDLQAAHDRFKGNIGLNQLILLCAADNGYRSGYESRVNIEAQRYAFNMVNANPAISAAGGFSTISISTILSNVANKFLMRGWNAVDDAWSKISKTRSVNDFKEVTTVSLTGGLEFEKVGAAGEIKHGTLGEETYGNKADTYAKMLAITRQDIINDDLGALTEVPMRLGRGGALKLNDIFWTEFLNNATFFVAGNNNVGTGALDAASLDAATTVFRNQTDPDGKPLGLSPRILLVPVGAEGAARRLMNSERLIGSTDGGDANIWNGRYTVVSSTYMSNTSYTGNSAVAWYLLADPMDLPVIEIAALNGNVAPVVETADADFNVLGVQMRGYSDVGVRKQEYRAGVRSTGA